MKPGDKIYWKPEALEYCQERFCITSWTPETLGIITDIDCSETGSHIEGRPYDWCIEPVDGDVWAPRVYVFESDIVHAKGQIPLPLKFKKKRRGLVMAELDEYPEEGADIMDEFVEVELPPPDFSRLIHNTAYFSTTDSATPDPEYTEWTVNFENTNNNEDRECEEDELF